MNARKARAAHRAEREAEVATQRPSFWRTRKGGLVTLAAAALVTGSFVLPDVVKDPSSGGVHAGMAVGAEHGEGLPTGSPVPSFSEQDVETGEAITSTTLFAGKTLLFFSEGVMCQACFEQIRDIEQIGSQLELRGIRLVSITPDSPGDLREAVSQYTIRSPMISDEDRDMSRAFNALGQGMHGDTPGHAFVLINKGKVLWYRDYWLAPTRSMYVDPQALLADIPA